MRRFYSEKVCKADLKVLARSIPCFRCRALKAKGDDALKAIISMHFHKGQELGSVLAAQMEKLIIFEKG
eukprot:814013-Pyramimonas_sp.AAC.1